MESGDFNVGSSQGFNSHSCVAGQLIGSPERNSQGYANGPVRSLMSALLFDGVQAFLTDALRSSGKRRASPPEAHQWVMRRGNDYIFAFDSVCEALGLDPDYLRLGLINACHAYQGDWKRARRNF